MSLAVSDRIGDAFDNPEKSAYRQRHLDALHEHAPELWEDDDRRRLRGSWLELMGSTGWRSLELLEGKGVLTHEQFVGVDLEAERIDAYRARYPRARWLAGDVLDHVEAHELTDVTVLHYDGYEAVGSPRVRHVAEQLSAVLRRGLMRFGAAAIWWNADLDAARLQGHLPGAALREHARALAGLLRSTAGPRRGLDVERLLPPGAEQIVSSGRFTGMIGAFQVYRGKSTGHRMACLRAVLR